MRPRDSAEEGPASVTDGFWEDLSAEYRALAVAMWKLGWNHNNVVAMVSEFGRFGILIRHPYCKKVLGVSCMKNRFCCYGA